MRRPRRGYVAAAAVGLAIGVWLGFVTRSDGVQIDRTPFSTPFQFKSADAAWKASPGLIRSARRAGITIRNPKPGKLWIEEEMVDDAVRMWHALHPCHPYSQDVAFERRRNITIAMVQAWDCLGVPKWRQAKLLCYTDVEGGTTHMDVWHGGSRGWQGGRFAGTDRVVGPLQIRPYHSHLAGVGVNDRVATLATFRVLTNPRLHATIGARLSLSAWAATSRRRCGT